MSDGPHRSLPMRRGWKKLAERADNCAFEPDQVAAAMPEAIEGDWREEVPPEFLDALRMAFGDPTQVSLFKSDCSEQLEKARPLAAGKPLAQLIVDCAIKVTVEGISENPLVDAVSNACQNHGTRGIRSVEEHYKRKSSGTRAQKVRGRLEGACTKASFHDIASRLLNSSGSPKSRTPKQTGLDHGVSIP